MPSAAIRRTRSQTWVAAARIEAGGGLVEEEDLRDRDEARGDVDAAPLASGVGLHLPPGGLGEPERLEKLRRAPLRVPPRQPEQPAHEDEVLLAGEVLVHGRELPRQAHLAADRAGLPHDVVTQDRRATGGRLEQRGEDADGGGLAGPVRPEQAVDASPVDAKIHAVQRAGRAEVLDQSCRLDRVRHRSRGDNELQPREPARMRDGATASAPVRSGGRRRRWGRASRTSA